MNKPLISICIPTYNRAYFLEKCLNSITKQFSDQKIEQNVNIFILDNQSEDNTEEIAKKFTNTFKNIKYIKDNKNRNIAQGIIKVASISNGKYLWVFSDDDLQIDNALNLIIKTIKSDQPNVIINNLNGLFEKQEDITSNLLKINQDYFFTNRTDFLKYLNKKIFNGFDFYTTFCSNYILKREVFNSYYYILNKFNGPLDLFPFHSIIFYSDAKLIVKIISTPTLFIRRNNESWGPKNIIKRHFYCKKLFSYHYNNIANFNKNNSPALFHLKINIKNTLMIRHLLIYLLGALLKKNKITRSLYYQLKYFKKNINKSHNF